MSFTLHTRSAAVACVTARQAIRCKNVIDDFQADSWNQLEEVEIGCNILLSCCIPLYLFVFHVLDCRLSGAGDFIDRIRKATVKWRTWYPQMLNSSSCWDSDI